MKITLPSPTRKKAQFAFFCSAKNFKATEQGPLKCKCRLGLPLYFWVPLGIPIIPVSLNLSSLLSSPDWEILSSCSLEINYKNIWMLCSPHGLFSFGVQGIYYPRQKLAASDFFLIYRHRENWKLGMRIIMTWDTSKHSMCIFQQAQSIYDYIGILRLKDTENLLISYLVFWNILLLWTLVLERNGIKRAKWGKKSHVEQGFLPGKANTSADSISIP